MQIEDLNKSGTLIPQGMTSAAEKMTFLSMQRERLRVLLSALDKEASELGPEAAIERDVEKRMAGEMLGEGLRKSKSEAEFDEIGREDLRGEGQGKVKGDAAGGGWLRGWGWSSKGAEGGKGEDVGVSSARDVGT